MATLNFTGAALAVVSTATTGYFPLFEGIYDGLTFGYYGNLYTAASDLGDFSLNKAFYAFKTTDGARSLASYFNRAVLVGVPATWNFSSEPEYVELSSFSLLPSFGASTYVDGWMGVHSFKNDTINLGDGSDYLSLRLNFDSYEFEEKSTTYKQLSDYVLDGGFRVAINGGVGNDAVSVSWGEAADYNINRKDSSVVTTFIPVAVVNGDAGNDDITICSMAAIVNGDTPGSTAPGGGCDIIKTDFLSDRISGGAASDVIIGCKSRGFLSSHAYKQALVQKDILTGGAGRDNFVIDSYNDYGLNGDRDFALITDFSSADRISSVYFRGDLVVDAADGTLAITATSAYAAGAYAYTARVYLDTDASNTVNAGDELLLYVAGAQPTAANFVYGI